VGLTCPSDNIWDGTNCLLPPIWQATGFSEQSVKFSMSPSTPYYAKINITGKPLFGFISQFVLSCQPTVGLLDASLRFMGNPSVAPDYNSLPIAIQYPQPGFWILKLVLLNASASDVTAKFQLTNGSLKVINVAKSVEFLNEHFSGEQNNFYWKQTKPNETLLVSVRARNITDPNPKIKVRMSQIPSSGDIFSVSDCNRLWCQISTSIKLVANPPLTTNWFIEVVRPEALQSNDSGYAIWFNSDCAHDCTKGNRGSCRTQGNETSRCICRYGWRGITCHEAGGLSQGIVTGIIAAVLGGLSLWFALIAHCCCMEDRDFYDFY